MPNTGDRIDPFRNFNFLVELDDNIVRASFTECSGIGATVEVIETREGGQNTTVHKLPGKTTYSDITLKSGVTNSTDLWDWIQQVIHGIVVRRNGAIIVYDLTNKAEVARWSFINAWPTRYEGPAFDAKGTDIAIDTLVLAHEGIRRG
jgi:phage tail-like protein